MLSRFDATMLVIGGLIALTGALTYAELGGMFSLAYRRWTKGPAKR